jgi:hypothetical protein
MSDIVIRAENPGKSYKIGHEKQEHYMAFRDVPANKALNLISELRIAISDSRIENQKSNERYCY